MAVYSNEQAIIFCSCGFCLLVLLFLAYSRIISYFHTWYGLSASLECMSEMRWLLHAARWKYSTQKLRKNRHLRTIPQRCLAISQLRLYVSTVEKKLVKQQYLLHVSLPYGELLFSNGWDRLVSLGHPSKFQRVLRLSVCLSY